MTADQLIQHLGMSTSISSGGGGGDGSGGTRARVPPQWDRLTREQRSLWVAEHSAQSSSNGGTTMSASAVQQHRTPAEQSIVLALVPSVLGGTAASTFSAATNLSACVSVSPTSGSVLTNLPAHGCPSGTTTLSSTMANGGHPAPPNSGPKRSSM